ncbi:MAG: hypothetical protein ACOYYF_08100 [Chloroflexota bacterium]|nr:hypothetical protein [Chloroflexota bacterium]MBI5704824.1 hypothetical protein [Chloroflexota bacterium]
MKHKLSILFVVLAIALASVSPAYAGRGNGPVGVIYVTSQGLYYETFATADPLPMKGRFQKLVVVNGQPQTEFGPGDPGYLGGRWWIDTNGNDVMDEGDHFFLCPLLGPGRAAP